MFAFDDSLVPPEHRACEKGLRPRWITLFEKLGINPAATAPLYADLVLRYTAPSRFYHDLQHVADVLAASDRLRSEVEDPLALQLAIWFHDAIYHTDGSVDNELLSAEFAVAELEKLGVAADCRQTVHALILDTRHREPPQTQDGRVIVDADLSTFAVPPARFDRHSADVRREFSHVPADLYCSSRITILTGMLARDHFYYTKTMCERHEEQARANLKRGIEQLKRGDLTFGVGQEV